MRSGERVPRYIMGVVGEVYYDAVKKLMRRLLLNYSVAALQYICFQK